MGMREYARCRTQCKIHPHPSQMFSALGNSPDLWHLYQGFLVNQLEETLRDPFSEEDWIMASLKLIYQLEEIIRELEPPEV
jgi:hypothetical protein